MISSLTSSACEASATSSSSGGDSVCRLVLAILFNPLYRVAMSLDMRHSDIECALSEKSSAESEIDVAVAIVVARVE